MKKIKKTIAMLMILIFMVGVSKPIMANAQDTSGYVVGGHYFWYTAGEGEDANKIYGRCHNSKHMSNNLICTRQDYVLVLNPTPEGCSDLNNLDKNYLNVDGFAEHLRILGRTSTSKVVIYKVETEGATTGGVKCETSPTEKGYYYAEFVFNKRAVKAFTIDDEWLKEAAKYSSNSGDDENQNADAMSYLSSTQGIVTITIGGVAIIAIVAFFIVKSKKKIEE